MVTHAGQRFGYNKFLSDKKVEGFNFLIRWTAKLTIFQKQELNNYFSGWNVLCHVSNRGIFIPAGQDQWK